MIHHGDLFDVLPTLDAESIDACVTDPPYGIGFMGKKWDTFAPSAGMARNVPSKTQESTNPNLKGRRRAPASSPSAVEYDRSLHGQREFQVWTERWAREVYRVTKPGGHLLVCGAPRSFHRMTCGLEDAGFVVRDCLSWLYGQGFPKSLNLGGGLGTALKPGWEPIVLARKPFKSTLSGNVTMFGTGALNIDACRIGEPEDKVYPVSRGTIAGGFHPGVIFRELHKVEHDGLGRWPANVVLDEDAATLLDEQSGELTSGGTPAVRYADKFRNTFGEFKGGESADGIGGSVGGASRFFYVAKPSREERDYGTHQLTAKQRDDSRKAGNPGGDNPRNRGLQPRGNFHPTVKPIELMRWLVRLVTPPNGIVLDPFTGSGTTGMACRYELREFIGIEREAEYVQIAEARIAAVCPLFDSERQPALTEATETDAVREAVE